MQCHLGQLLLKLTNSYWSTSFSFFFLFQIGSNWAITAAHCGYDKDLEENFPASSLTIVLGLHNRTRMNAHARYCPVSTNQNSLCYQESACCWTDCTFRQQYHSENSWHCPPEIRYEMIQHSLRIHSNLRGKGGPEQVSPCLPSFPWTELWWQYWHGLRWSLL